MGPRPLESRDSRRNFSGLQRTGSAKQLIELYETRQQTICSTPPLSSLSKPPIPSPRQKKDKSPIRQSLSKVIGLFKKGPSIRQIPSIAPLQYTPSGSRLSGSLLYLSRHSSGSTWSPCTAELEWGCLRLICIDPQAEFNSFPIQLKFCSDVRSISTSEISEEDLMLLQATSTKGFGDPRIFELVFDDMTETFAAPSVSERASWVSTIWDSILLMQESKSIYRFEDSEKLHSTRLELRLTPNADLSKPLPQPSEERSLPALPPQSEHDTADDSGFSSERFSNEGLQSRNTPPCSVPPIVAHSLSVPPTSPHSLRSTSIANLSKRSMVRQRLAQIEKEYSQDSVDSLPLSPRRNRPLPSPLSPRRDQDMKQDMQRTNSGDSIFDSYGCIGPTPPVSASQPWTRPAVSPIAEDVRNETTGIDFSHDDMPLRIDTRQETLDCKAHIEPTYGFSMSTRPCPDTADLIAAQEVQNSKQLVALNDIRHILSNVNKDVSTTGYTMTSIDQRLEKLDDCIGSMKSQIGSSSKQTDNAQDLVDIQESLGEMKMLLTSGVANTLKQLVESSKCRTSPTASESTSCTSTEEVQKQLTEMLALVRDQNDKNAQRDVLQADSVRYLNELNVWLETFVNGGTSQIQVLSASLQQVLHSLGVITPQDGVQDEPNLAQGQLVNDQGVGRFCTSLNNAIGPINGQGGAVNPISTQAIVEAIERQRQDHEGLMRLLTSELSNEIKGERLRFVEAMKEATAINIQAQVEELKNELKREVHGMTEEVGRLHQEKQNIENQIADLLAFYSKQASNGSIPPGSVPALEQVISNHSAPQRVRGVGGLRTPQASPERHRRGRY
ncbi:hypothetical protein F5878DRAFT_682282 [Lentinula raphanica]|uniref:PH domain-containing protein n=1 Tax=Lentinula raphanica TaxID=153919 RepID=A0AA38PK74_9AGAR|nr:hypothetical protein F5880DRAFT_1699449 [Lentinula raphanica]KAJ3844168.1 hypothetical protein F5878DRAFT_682282 [Lentinula raphanica]